MILNMNGCYTTSVHLICFRASKNNSYLTVYPKLGWTNNLNFARCYNSIEEALNFLNLPLVKSFIDDENVNMVWIDTNEAVIL